MIPKSGNRFSEKIILKDKTNYRGSVVDPIKNLSTARAH